MKLLKLSFIVISFILNLGLIFYTYKVVVPEKKSLTVLKPEESQYKKKSTIFKWKKEIRSLWNY